MCGIKKERETRQPGRGDKEEEEGEGVFSIAPVERRELKGRERKKKRENRDREKRERDIFWDRLPKCRESYNVQSESCGKFSDTLRIRLWYTMAKKVKNKKKKKHGKKRRYDIKRQKKTKKKDIKRTENQSLEDAVDSVSKKNRESETIERHKGGKDTNMKNIRDSKERIER